MESLIGKVYSDFIYELKHDQAILYSLSTGATYSDLPFIYENHPEFEVFPTMATAIGLRDIDAFFKIPQFQELTSKKIPEILLHGEEEQEITQNLIPGNMYRIKSSIKDITDKGKLIIVTIQKDISREGTNNFDVKITTRFVLRGVGGTNFLNKLPHPQMELPKQPENQPDEEVPEIPTLTYQNALYRLNGDKNLIHIDLNVAANAGFDRPILHGLCTYAMSARAVFNILNRPKIEKIGSRFTSHVFPGETLSLKIWRITPEKVVYETRVKERGTVAMKGFMQFAQKRGYSGLLRKLC